MVKLLSFPQREFSMSTWRYILNLCKNMSEAEASLVVAVLLIAATSLWAGNLLIGAVLALAIIFAMLVTLPLWGIVLILAGTLWRVVRAAKRVAMQASACAPES